mgnify:CR=1 FL=1
MFFISSVGFSFCYDLLIRIKAIEWINNLHELFTKLLTPQTAFSYANSHRKPMLPFHLGIIISSLSLVSLAAVLVLFIVVRRRVSNFFVKLGIYLMLADVPMLISAFFDVTTGTEPPIICDLTAIFRQYSNLSTMLWNVLIVWTVYTTIVNNLVEEHMLIFKRKFLLATLIVPLLFAILPVAVGKYEGSNSSCWISTSISTRAEFILYDGTYLLSLFVSIIFIVRYYIRMIIFLKEYTIEEVSGEFYALSLFPIVLIIVNIPDVASRLYVIISESQSARWTEFVQVGLRMSQVFINSVLFTLNPKVWIALRRFCNRRKKKKETNLLSLQGSIDYKHLADNYSEHSDDSSYEGSSSSSSPTVFRGAARRFTAHPELISKVFDIKAPGVNNPTSARRSTHYS